MAEESWVFVVKVQDAPGALTAIASVFSSRGVSLETILGNGVSTDENGRGSVVLSFHATEKKKATLQRTVARLAKVGEVQAYPLTAPEVRSIAILRLSPAESELPALLLPIEVLAATATGTTILLNGDAKSVEEALLTLRTQRDILDAVVSIMTV